MNRPDREEILLAARDLELGYGTRTVLRAVNFAVHAGEFWFLLGANGAGKSTLLEAILGLQQPRAGTIFRHPEWARWERIGFVPQRCEFNPSLPTTVREFVLLGLVGAPVERSQRDDRLRSALEGAGLRELANTSYGSLSGGQRRRALVARALVRRPSLMILDEPTEGLDPVLEDTLIASLSRLNFGDGLTLLFVTHKLSVATRYASHVALFHSGTLHAGPRDEILVPAELQRAYGPGLFAAADGGSNRP